MKYFKSPKVSIVSESVRTVPYINIGGQWDSSHHKLSQTKGTVKGQMGQFNDVPHKNLSSLKGQKNKKRALFDCTRIVQKKHLSPLAGTVQDSENRPSQKDKNKGLMPSRKDKQIMSSKNYYVNFLKMQVIVKQALTEIRCKRDIYFSYAKKSSRLGSYMGDLSHIYVFLSHYWTCLFHWLKGLVEKQ